LDNPTEDVGTDVAFTFDYGVVQSAEYGNANIQGHVLCLVKFEDRDALLDAATYTETTFVDVATGIMNDLIAIGGNFDVEKDQRRLGFEGRGCELADGLTILYPSIPIEETKVGVLATALAGLIDDGVEQAVAEGRSLEPFMATCRGALSGAFTHLDQAGLGELPDYFHMTVGMLILLRKEAILKSKSEETWGFVEKDFLDYIHACCIEYEEACSSVEDYLRLRDHTVGGQLGGEIHWIILGLQVPAEVRRDPDFARFKSLLSIYIGLFNDVTGLRKEVERGETHNIVMVLVQTMPLQRAVDESLKVMESIFFEIKDRARGLLGRYKAHTDLEEILHSVGRLAGCGFVGQEMYSHRYGLEPTHYYSIVEFNESYMMKERQMENILLESEPHETNNKSTEDHQESEPGSPGQETKEILPGTNTEPACAKLPKHVAIIPDGNRRWAKNQGHAVWAGHDQSCQIGKVLVPELFDRGIHSITIWGLSPDNYKRPKSELDFLWFQFEKFSVIVRKLCTEYGARFLHIGKTERIPARVMRIIKQIENESKDRTAHCVTLALDYGGIEEVIQAVNQVEGDVSAEGIAQHLYAASKNVLYPTPDLVVRTGSKDAGTVRMSGFMVWQAAQAELFFENKYMPDVNSEDVSRWLEAYAQSDQRLGK